MFDLVRAALRSRFFQLIRAFARPDNKLSLEQIAASGGFDELQHHVIEEELKRLSFPFDKNFQVILDVGRQDPFFQDHYFGVAGEPVEGRPGEKELAWRRIDTDWLGSAGQLGLQLDSDTNNTSLALAIELVGSGKVLLFAADAQATLRPFYSTPHRNAPPPLAARRRHA